VLTSVLHVKGRKSSQKNIGGKSGIQLERENPKKVQVIMSALYEEK
jgi:hypothetical protein